MNALSQILQRRDMLALEWTIPSWHRRPLIEEKTFAQEVQTSFDEAESWSSRSLCSPVLENYSMNVTEGWNFVFEDSRFCIKLLP